jgi:hypothetical protein
VVVVVHYLVLNLFSHRFYHLFIMSKSKRKGIPLFSLFPACIFFF